MASTPAEVPAEAVAAVGAGEATSSGTGAGAVGAPGDVIIVAAGAGTPAAAAAPAAAEPPPPPALLPVTDIAVTYMTVGPNDTYVRFGRTATPAYLWLTRGGGASGDADPITDIRVQWADSVPPESAGTGWARLEGDLNNGGTTPDKAAFLWIRRASATAATPGLTPLVDLKVVTSDDPVVGPGFAKLEDILNPQALAIKDSTKEFLCFKTVASAAKAAESEFAVGDVVDAKDSSNNWCVAQIMGINEKGEFHVHYKGWSEKWDEWVDKKAKRLAPYKSKTLGKATGWEGDRDAFIFPTTDRAGDFFNIVRRLDAIDAKLESKDAKERELTKEEFIFLTGGDCHKFVLNSLNAIIDDVEMLSAVQGFLQRNLRLYIRAVRRDADLPTSYVDALVKIFKGDPQSTRFYSKYGVKGTETNAVGKFCTRGVITTPVTGDDKTILSAYLVENINYFGDNGGFEAITARLNSATFEDSFFLVALLVKVVACVRPLLIEEVAKSFLATIPFETLLESRIRRITDVELKTLNKDSINDLVRDVEGLMNVIHPPAFVAEFIEKINLEIALRLLSAKVLEKRLNGCGELEETIKRVIRKQKEDKVAAAAAELKEGVPPPAGGAGPAPVAGVDAAAAPAPAAAAGGAPAAAGAGAIVIPPVIAAAAGAQPGAVIIHVGGGGPVVVAAPEGPSAKFLTVEFLIKWIDDNKVVDIFLGPSSHEQIIKRSPGLLKFLAANGALTTEHVEQLWQCSIGKHESLMRIVYDTLAVLAEALSESQLDSLYTRITSVPFHDYTDFVLLFIKNFTINAVKGAKEKGVKWYGLDLFWQLIQDDVKVSPQIAAQSATMLKDLLEQPTFETQRSVYIEKCMVGLRDGRSVVMCLRVAQTIVQMYPALPPGLPKVAGVVSSEEVVTGLETKYGVLKLFIDDMSRYNAQTRKAMSEYKGTDKDPIFVGRAPHSLQVAARLGFLDFLVTRSPLVVTAAVIDVLWDVLVTHGVTTDDKFTLLEWLTNCVDEGRPRQFQVFGEGTAKTVFANYLCEAKRLEYGNLTKKAYDCFETYFCNINFAEGALSSTSRRYIAVLDFSKLIGIEALWNMSAAVIDGDVSASAKKFLTTLHIRLDFKYSADDKKLVFKSFIERAMGTLAAAGKELAARRDIESGKRIVQSFLELVESFLARCEAGETIEKPKFTADEAVKAIWKGGTRIYDARVLSLNRDGTYVVRYADGDHDRMCPESSLFKLPGSVVEEKKVDEVETNQYPRLLLSNDNNYFTLLFELLETSGELAPRVWKLLCRLPTNKDLALKIKTLSARGAEGKVLWDELLPSTSAIKLLYSLQIVDANMTVQPTAEGAPAEAAEAQKKEVADWAAGFLTLGGFTHLYNILATSDVAALLSDTLPQQCLSLTLKLVQFFLLGADAAAAGALIDPSKLVTRLLNVISGCADAPYVPPTNAANVPAAPRYAAPVTTATSTSLVTVGTVGMPSLLDASGDPEDMDFEAMTMVGPLPPPVVSPALAAASAGAAVGADGASSSSSSAGAAAVVGAPGGAAAPAGPPAEQGPPADDTYTNLVVHASSLLLALLSNAPDLLTLVYAYPTWKQVIVQGLLKNGNPHLRKFLSQSLLHLCVRFNKLEGKEAKTEAKVPRLVFLPILLEILSGLDASALHCSDFFNLVASLLKGSRPEDGSFDPSKLASELVEKIKTHPITEKRAEDIDWVLCGLFNLTKELLQRVPTLKEALGSTHGLINELKDCLFEVPKQTTSARAAGPKRLPPPKCKSARTRRMAFALLGELARDCPVNHRQLVVDLTGNHVQSHTGGRRPEDWQFESKSEEKAEAGYVGLKNLGCICYMNALVQQLFMIPRLRQNLLAIDCDLLKEDKKESVTYNLQYIMALLQESEKQYANPVGFCYAFKDFDGKPTNVRIQEDAGGFYTRLIDVIDEKLKGTPHVNAFREVLAGTFSHELIGKGCPHYKEREEEFYAVTLQVQNKKTMQESLQAFVQGEMLEGENAFRCSQCNKKVDTLKRQSLKRLPPTISFVLKRFALDYQTMQTTKLNDRLEFPILLDLKPYCKESLGLPPRDPTPPVAATASGGAATPAAAPAKTADGKSAEAPKVEAPKVEEKKEEEVKHPDEYYQYVLRGVVVHTGGAQSGHYYSFIQERLVAEGAAPGAPEVAGKWYEFNDTMVRDFRAADLASECYGGVEAARAPISRYAGIGSSSNMVSGPSVGYEKSRSGYILFYDRVKPAEVVVAPVAPVTSSSSSSSSTPSPAAVAKVAASASTPLSVGGAASAALFASKMSKVKDDVRARAAVPPPIFQDIWDSNLTYWRDKAVFDGGYFDFLWDIMGGDEKEPPSYGVPVVKEGDAAPVHTGPIVPGASEVTKLVTSFVFNTLARAYRKDKFGVWMEYLRKLYANNPNAAAWLLNTMVEGKWNKEFLLACHDGEVRGQVGHFICSLLQQLTPYEQESYASAAPEKKEVKEAKEKEAKEAKEGKDAAAAAAVTETKESKDERGVCVRYVDNVVGFLRSAPEYWKTFDPMFRVLAFFAGLGLREAQYLEKHNLSARLVDFFLGDESPKPTVGDIPVDEKGRRRTMGDAYSLPDTTNFWFLLRHLVCASLPEIGEGKELPPSLSVGKDQKNEVLPRDATELLLGKAFLPRLLQEATTRRRARAINDIVVHQSWENERVSQSIVSLIFAGIEANSYDQIRSYFRILSALVGLKDSFAAKRTDWILTSLLNVMKVQAKFWKVTDFCIEHLIRMAKRTPEVAAWLAARPASYEWVLTWLTANPRPPRDHDSSETTILHKPGKGPSESASVYSMTSSRAFPTHVGLSPRRKHAALDLIRQAQPIDKDDCTDSDIDLQDRTFEIGQWVDCLDQGNKWLCAQVVAQQTSKIWIKYDGWSDRWNNWFDKASIRIQPFGKYTTPDQHKARGKKKDQA